MSSAFCGNESFDGAGAPFTTFRQQFGFDQLQALSFHPCFVSSKT